MLSRACTRIFDEHLPPPSPTFLGDPNTFHEPRSCPLGYFLSSNDYVQVLFSGAMGQGYSELSPLTVTKDIWEPLNSCPGWSRTWVGKMWVLVEVSLSPSFKCSQDLGLFFPASTDAVPTRQGALISPQACDTRPG